MWLWFLINVYEKPNLLLTCIILFKCCVLFLFIKDNVCVWDAIMLPVIHVIFCIFCTPVHSSATVFVRGCPVFVLWQGGQVLQLASRCSRLRGRCGRFVSLTPALPARRRSGLLNFVTKQRFTQDIFGWSLQSFLPVELEIEFTIELKRQILYNLHVRGFPLLFNFIDQLLPFSPPS